MNYFSFLAVMIKIIGSSDRGVRSVNAQIQEYIKNHISTEKVFANSENLVAWDQTMINAFYHYCFEYSVIPTINLSLESVLRLNGSPEHVTIVFRKFQLMSDILKHRLLAQKCKSTMSDISKYDRDNISDKDNLYFIYCPMDEFICGRLKKNLLKDGYSVQEHSSTNQNQACALHNFDASLICFSDNFLKDPMCMEALRDAKQSHIPIIPILIINEQREDNWLSSVTIAGSFYECFEQEINLEIGRDFDIEYDVIHLSLVSNS